MKMKLIAGSLALAFICGCTHNPATVQEVKKQGFSITTFGYDYPPDSSLAILIQFGGIQYDLPKISINSHPIDSGYSPDGFGYKLPYPYGDRFTYTIEYDGDRISDTVLIPERIDSVYCNGLLLKDTTLVTIGIYEAYLFSWNKGKNNLLYDVQLWSSIADDYKRISSDTSVILSPTRQPPQYGGMYGGLYLYGMSYPEMTVDSRPNRESDRMFVYYNGIRGQCRKVDFTIE